MLRALWRMAGSGAYVNALIVSAVMEYMQHGEPETMQPFPGPLMMATADVPLSIIHWVRAVAPFQEATEAEAWRVVLASFLSRHEPPALEVAAPGLSSSAAERRAA